MILPKSFNLGRLKPKLMVNEERSAFKSVHLTENCITTPAGGSCNLKPVPTSLPEPGKFRLKIKHPF